MIKNIESKDKEGKSNTVEFVAGAILCFIVFVIILVFKIWDNAYINGKCDAHHGILITMPNNNVECVNPNSIQKINVSND